MVFTTYHFQLLDLFHHLVDVPVVISPNCFNLKFFPYVINKKVYDNIIKREERERDQLLGVVRSFQSRRLS